MEKEDMDKEG